MKTTNKKMIGVSIETITPQKATDWLRTRFEAQRPVRLSHIQRLAADMAANRFKIGPDAILRVKGRLANGQHRLEAVVLSDKPQTFIVMESDDDELYKIIDAGLRRTVSDGLVGLPYAKTIPSIARWVQAYEKESLWAGCRTGAMAASRNGRDVRSTQIETIDYCIEYQHQLTEAASFVNPMYEETRLLPLSIGGALYVIGENAGKGDLVREFLRQLYVAGEHPVVNQLRNRLISNRGLKTQLRQGYVFGITLKALKAFCSGTAVGTLKWINGEAFPKL
jgi:hypothetical protein